MFGPGKLEWRRPTDFPGYTLDTEGLARWEAEYRTPTLVGLTTAALAIFGLFKGWHIGFVAALWFGGVLGMLLVVWRMKLRPPQCRQCGRVMSMYYDPSHHDRRASAYLYACGHCRTYFSRIFAFAAPRM